MIVAAVDLARPRLARRHRDRHARSRRRLRAAGAASVVLPAPEGEDSTSSRPAPCDRWVCDADRAAHSMFCTCSRIWSITVFKREAGARDLGVVGLRAQRVGLAIELLGEEVELAADGLAGRPAARARRRCARQALQLLLDVGAGGEQHRLLMQPRGIERWAGLQQACDLLLQARLDRLRLRARARRRPPPPGARSSSSCSPSTAAEPGAFRGARGDERTAAPASRLASIASMRAAASRPRLVGLGHLEHALDGQQRPRRAAARHRSAARTRSAAAQHLRAAPPR